MCFKGKWGDESSYLPALPLCVLYDQCSIQMGFSFFFFYSLNISIYDDLTLGTDLKVLPKTNTQISERVFNHNTSISPSLKLEKLKYLSSLQHKHLGKLGMHWIYPFMGGMNVSSQQTMPLLIPAHTYQPIYFIFICG